MARTYYNVPGDRPGEYYGQRTFMNEKDDPYEKAGLYQDRREDRGYWGGNDAIGRELDRQTGQSSGSSSRRRGSSSGDAYSSALQAALEAQRKATEQAVGQLEANKPALQQQRDDAARQAYIQYMQQQYQTPQQLKAAGLTGGASESSLIAQNANYGNQQADILGAYNNSLAMLEKDIANVKATGDISQAQTQADYLRELENWQRQQEYEQQRLQEEREYALQQYERELRDQKEMTAYQYALQNQYAARSTGSAAAKAKDPLEELTKDYRVKQVNDSYEPGTTEWYRYLKALGVSDDDATRLDNFYNAGKYTEPTSREILAAGMGPLNSNYYNQMMAFGR